MCVHGSLRGLPWIGRGSLRPEKPAGGGTWAFLGAREPITIKPGLFSFLFWFSRTSSSTALRFALQPLTKIHRARISGTAHIPRECHAPLLRLPRDLTLSCAMTRGRLCGELTQTGPCETRNSSSHGKRCWAQKIILHSSNTCTCITGGNTTFRLIL